MYPYTYSIITCEMKIKMQYFHHFLRDCVYSGATAPKSLMISGGSMKRERERSGLQVHSPKWQGCFSCTGWQALSSNLSCGWRNPLMWAITGCYPEVGIGSHCCESDSGIIVQEVDILIGTFTASLSACHSENLSVLETCPLLLM